MDAISCHECSPSVCGASHAKRRSMPQRSKSHLEVKGQLLAYMCLSGAQFCHFWKNPSAYRFTIRMQIVVHTTQHCTSMSQFVVKGQKELTCCPWTSCNTLSGVVHFLLMYDASGDEETFQHLRMRMLIWSYTLHSLYIILMFCKSGNVL